MFYQYSLRCVLLLVVLNFSENLVIQKNERTIRQAGNESVGNAITEIFNDCKCVDYYLCDEENFIITDGRTLIQERFGENSKRIVCGGGDFRGQKVCCKLRTKTLKEPKHIGIPDDGAKDETTVLEETVTTPKTKKKTSCGTPLPTINIRIFAGEDEIIPMNGEFPWIAAIFRNVDGQYQFHCSGSLIHPKVVLTASHCVRRYGSSSFEVTLNGEIELKSLSDTKGVARRKVTEIISHPEYSSGTLSNDIALLILREPFQIGKHDFHVNTLCLPDKNANIDELRCLVAGWGKTPNDDGKRVMKKVELPMITDETCQELLRKTRLGPNFDLDKTFICAGGEEGRDACKGDGGSPLMCPLGNNGRYFQAGIVSWGIGCGRKNVPGVYTKVAHFHDWIENELKTRQL